MEITAQGPGLDRQKSGPSRGLVYGFGHYSMSRTTQSYQIPFDRQRKIVHTRTERMEYFTLAEQDECNLVHSKTGRSGIALTRFRLFMFLLFQSP